ncbi:hypothetical protein [Xiamenia xianingshaonis]|uniref:Uncharacterized protein n=1 Tax=Xiamenia xianingshaonis TaxID=2682776 RepID=A0A9E6SUW5_9ACTN|nr:hypothetical protein [Xiamenia xianingshaonis]QTU84925.1 hypothetical protein J7S26_03170 [Xiamenia xianingshaonis]
MELKRQGLADVDICQALGMSQSAFYRWIQIGSDTTGAYEDDKNIKLKRALVEGLKKAEADYKATLLETIKAAALEKTCNWTAAAWLLERKYPNEFGKSERRFDEGKTAAPTIVLGVPVAVIEREPVVEAEVEVVRVDDSAAELARDKAASLPEGEVG